MKRIVLVVALSVCGSAFAWGDREQGALAGIVGTIVLGNVLRAPEPQVQAPPVIIQRREVMICNAYNQCIPQTQPSPYCSYHPYYDQFGRVAYYEKVCR